MNASLLAPLGAALACLLPALAPVDAGTRPAPDAEPAQDRASAPAYALHCGRLITVPGEPVLEDVWITVRGDRITAIDDHRPLGAFDAEHAIDLTGHTVLAGLFDCHVHLSMEISPRRRLEQVTLDDADRALVTARHARATLDAGFTTVRDLASEGDAVFAVRDAQAAGWLAAPTILVAGNMISPTGGHGDRTLGYRGDLYDLPTPERGAANGVAECRKAVRAQVRRGADLIKISATGGVLSETATGTDQQFFEDELRALVDTAHQLGRKITAHAHGRVGMRLAVEAGVDSIEHGSFLDEACLEAFQAHDTWLVPTLLAGDTVLRRAREGGWFPPAVVQKAEHVAPAVADSFARALAGGVRIAFGTDTGVSPHGENAREAALMVAAGMTPEQVLRSATVDAAELCGLDDRGRVEVGLRADLIAVKGDPLRDVRVLERVDFVMKDGRPAKRGGRRVAWE